MELKKSWILMMNWTSDLQILHSNAQPNEFKDMQLTWKILIVFLSKSEWRQRLTVLYSWDKNIGLLSSALAWPKPSQNRNSQPRWWN